MAENDSPNPSPQAPPAGSGGAPPIGERIATVMAHPAYMDATHAEHAGVVNQVRLLYQEQDRLERGEPEPTEQDGEDSFLDANDAKLEPLPHIDTLRRQAGVDAPTLPESIKENWSESGEADFLSAAVDAGLNKAQITAILDRYTTELVVGGRSVTGEREGDAAAWLDFMKSINVPDAFAKRLIAWHRANSQRRD
jgi:hypothetical protein